MKYAIFFAIAATLVASCASNTEDMKNVTIGTKYYGLNRKTYQLRLPGSVSLMAAPAINVRSVDWSISGTLDALRVSRMSDAELTADLRSLSSIVRPSAPQQISKTDGILRLRADSIRGWARSDGFLSIVDKNRHTKGSRTLFSARDAADAALAAIARYPTALRLDKTQSLDILAVKEVRGSMVDPTTFQQIMVVYPGTREPTKTHVVSYRVLFGRRHKGTPILGGAFAISLSPQGKVVEVSRFWRRVAPVSDLAPRVLAQDTCALPSLAVAKQAKGPIERRGCGYNEHPRYRTNDQLGLSCRIVLHSDETSIIDYVEL